MSSPWFILLTYRSRIQRFNLNRLMPCYLLKIIQITPGTGTDRKSANPVILGLCCSLLNLHLLSYCFFIAPLLFSVLKIVVKYWILQILI